jgi:hypothetical protein
MREAYTRKKSLELLKDKQEQAWKKHHDTIEMKEIEDRVISRLHRQSA